MRIQGPPGVGKRATSLFFPFAQCIDFSVEGVRTMRQPSNQVYLAAMASPLLSILGVPFGSSLVTSLVLWFVGSLCIGVAVWGMVTETGWGKVVAGFLAPYGLLVIVYGFYFCTFGGWGDGCQPFYG